MTCLYTSVLRVYVEQTLTPNSTPRVSLYPILLPLQEVGPRSVWLRCCVTTVYLARDWLRCWACVCCWHFGQEVWCEGKSAGRLWERVQALIKRDLGTHSPSLVVVSGFNWYCCSYVRASSLAWGLTNMPEMVEWKVERTGNHWRKQFCEPFNLQTSEVQNRLLFWDLSQ